MEVVNLKLSRVSNGITTDYGLIFMSLGCRINELSTLRNDEVPTRSDYIAEMQIRPK